MLINDNLVYCRQSGANRTANYGHIRANFDFFGDTTDILGQKSTELSVVLHFSVSFYSADT